MPPRRTDLFDNSPDNVYPAIEHMKSPEYSAAGIRARRLLSAFDRFEVWWADICILYQQGMSSAAGNAPLFQAQSHKVGSSVSFYVCRCETWLMGTFRQRVWLQQ